jgi:hypothetical protein
LPTFAEGHRGLEELRSKKPPRVQNLGLFCSTFAKGSSLSTQRSILIITNCLPPADPFSTELTSPRPTLIITNCLLQLLTTCKEDAIIVNAASQNILPDIADKYLHCLELFLETEFSDVGYNVFYVGLSGAADDQPVRYD